MSALKSGSTLRSLVLTPERIPSFLIPSRSPLLFSSRPHPDRTRLLSDPDDSPVESPKNRGSPAASRFLLRLPPPPRIRARRRTATAAEDADTDLTTRAAMSLPHVEKVTTPYGFRAVLAASPCTRRRESLFHRNKPVTVTVKGPDRQRPGPSKARTGRARTGRARILQPVKALGLQVMKELKRPAAGLRALSRRQRDLHLLTSHV